MEYSALHNDKQEPPNYKFSMCLLNHVCFSQTAIVEE